MSGLDLDLIGCTACFTGHRHLSSPEIPRISRLLTDTVRKLWKSGFRRFLCGAAMGFDLLAAESVIALREELEGLRLILVIPCADQTRNWNPRDREKWNDICGRADEKVILSPFYYEGCMQVRNRYMVDRSSVCVAYMRHGNGGTSSTVSYALQSGVEVVNIAMEM